jgi:glycosyltransferase involved in cell wall biosynthesis
MSPPLVSIVIPTYNHAHFLGEAIESALAQGSVATEIIVVDDGSTDDPAAVVSRYPGVRLIRQKNAGLAAARNTGWRAASGAFVVFLDADDRLLPGAVEANLLLHSANPGCAFVYGRYRLISADGTVRKEPLLVPIGQDPFAGFLRGNAVGMHGTVMYRRECLEDSGGFDPALLACEDYDLYLRLSRTHKVACSPELIADYRMHGRNMSRRYPFMLDWALATLRRQRRAARGNPDHRQPYRDGIRNWKRHYVKQQLGCIWAGPGWSSVLHLMQIGRRAPATIVSVASRALLLRVPRRR